MERSAIHDNKINLKKGPWTPEEDKKLIDYIQNHGHGSWRNLPRHAGLNRCGKSCRLRWTNYLRPDIKRGKFSEEEDRLIIHLHSLLGNKWSTIATRLSGRTDNEIKNYWNTHLRKKLLLMGIDPVTHRQRADLDLLASFPNLIATTNLGNLPNAWNKLQQDAAQLTRFQLLQSLIQFMVTTASPPNLNALNLFAPAVLRNYEITDLLQLNYQLEGFINGSLSLPQDPIGMTAGLAPPFGIQQLANNFQVFPPTDGSCSSELSMENNGVDANQMFSSYNIPTADSTPSLVSASPKNPTVDQTPEPIYSVDASAESSTSITSETWEELNLGDLDEDLCWKDILDQTKWSSDK